MAVFLDTISESTPQLDKPYIIAEVGSNWLSEEPYLAIQHIIQAKECGCDAVKFQLFNSVELYGYRVKALDQYALPQQWLGLLKEECDKHKIDFMCTAFSPEGLKLVDPLVRAHKIASSDMKYVQLLDAAESTGKPILWSTGGATMNEIEQMWRPEFIPMECVANYPAETKHYR